MNTQLLAGEAHCSTTNRPCSKGFCVGARFSHLKVVVANAPAQSCGLTNRARPGERTVPKRPPRKRSRSPALGLIGNLCLDLLGSQRSISVRVWILIVILAKDLLAVIVQIRSHFQAKLGYPGLR